MSQRYVLGIKTFENLLIKFCNWKSRCKRQYESKLKWPVQHVEHVQHAIAPDVRKTGTLRDLDGFGHRMGIAKYAPGPGNT